MSKVKFPEAEFNALASALMGIDRRKLYKLVSELVGQLNEFKEWAHSLGWHIRRRREMLELRSIDKSDVWFKVFSINEAHRFISRLDEPAEVKRMLRHGTGVEESEALRNELLALHVLYTSPAQRGKLKGDANATDTCDAEVVTLVVPRRASK